MATLNTKIESLLVDGQKVIARFSSTNSQSKFEAKLNGWAKWKEVANPATFSDLAPGIRTLEVRSFNRRGQPDPTPATRTFTIVATTPTPDPDPEPSGDDPREGMRLYRALTTVGDWDENVTAASGASITNVSKDGQPAIRFYQPNPGERTELQVYDEKLNDEPASVLYTWEQFIPANVRWPAQDDSGNIICQQHGNNQAGYTGGISIRDPSARIVVRIKGGHQTSTAGSHRYEYESDGKGGSPAVPEGSDEFGTVVRDRWQRVDYHAKWSTEWDGFVRCSLAGGPITEIKNVPTYSDVSDLQMYRLGFYSGEFDGPLEMFIRKAEIWLPV